MKRTKKIRRVMKIKKEDVRRKKSEKVRKKKVGGSTRRRGRVGFRRDGGWQKKK